jgi:hypothetical protein
MVPKRIKLVDEAISKILIADIDSEQMLRLAMQKKNSGKKRKNSSSNSSSSSSNNRKLLEKTIHRLQQVKANQHGDRLKERTQIFIPMSVQQMCEDPHINTDGTPLSVLIYFSQKYSICWWNTPT